MSKTYAIGRDFHGEPLFYRESNPAFIWKPTRIFATKKAAIAAKDPVRALFPSLTIKTFEVEEARE